MKFTDGNRSGDSDDFIDLVDEEKTQIEMNLMKNRKERREDEPLLSDYLNDTDDSNSGCDNDENSESDSYGDDEFYDEEEEKGERIEYVDLNSICEDIRSDVKDCVRYVINQGGVFWQRLKQEWNDTVFGDSYEYDFQGTETLGESLDEM